MLSCLFGEDIDKIINKDDIDEFGDYSLNTKNIDIADSAQKSKLKFGMYEAEFEFRIGNAEVRKVKEGETFQIPGIGITFKVLSIEENKAVIVPVDGPNTTGEPITVKKG